MLGVVVVQLVEEGLVGSLGELAFLIEKRDDTQRARFHQLDAILIVVEFDVGPIDFLAGILLLFELENRLIEKLLQLFVGIIDTKLLEAVHLLK